MTAGAGAVAEADADAPLRELLAAALGANERLARLAGELREQLASRDAELERVKAELAVLQRLVFGRSSERDRPDGPGGMTAAGTRAATAAAAVTAAGRGGRGRGRGGGITRICPGSR